MAFVKYSEGKIESVISTEEVDTKKVAEQVEEMKKKVAEEQKVKKEDVN